MKCNLFVYNYYICENKSIWWKLELQENHVDISVFDCEGFKVENVSPVVFSLEPCGSKYLQMVINIDQIQVLINIMEVKAFCNTFQHFGTEVVSNIIKLSLPLIDQQNSFFSADCSAGL